MTDTTQKMLPKQLAKLIRDHTKAQVALSWAGSQAAEDYELYVQDAHKAQRHLEEGFKLVTGYEAIFPTLRD